jgi:alkanesulfonate monooxygenase SsuD/methylene tetrahydromethanopterin reductase-like flavin-dependent oxidoreductase (luciferase family)
LKVDVSARNIAWNLVCGWNEGEFEMFGATLRVLEARYKYAQEWLAIVKLAWSAQEYFDFDGRFFNLKSVRAKPKPYLVSTRQTAGPVARACATIGNIRAGDGRISPDGRGSP